jgi:uncharacterized protein YjlB
MTSHVFLSKKVNIQPEKYFVEDDGLFHNSRLPILFYPKILRLPKLFPAAKIKKFFQENNWKNNWKQGIYTYHHYHSITHEVPGVCEGETVLLLGGEKGLHYLLKKEMFL